MLPHQLGRGAGVGRKAVDKLRRKNIQIARITVVTEIPDDLRSGFERRAEHGEKAAEVQSAAAIDQRPAQPVARGAHTGLRQHAIVFERLNIVLDSSDHIHALPQGIYLAGGLESSYPKRRKDIALQGTYKGGVRHSRTL